MRDPRIDPLPFDRIESTSGGPAREVVYVTVGGHVVYDTVGVNRDQQTVALKTWRRWAKNGNVLNRGPDDVIGPYKREVVFNFGIQGQLTRLANHVARDHRISTPDEEALLVLLEMGIERVLTSADEEAAFKKAMARRITPRNDPY